MKFFTSFLLVCLLALSGPVHAQTAPSHNLQATDQSAPAKSLDNIFGMPQKKIPPTPEQIDESFKVYDQCNGSDMVGRYYDCDCLARNFLEIRPANPKTPIDDLVQIVRKDCANTSNIAGDAYDQCVTWSAKLRTDYIQYCTCYANSYAKKFAATPSDSIRGREALMTVALDNCKSGHELEEDNSRKTFIDWLKKRGLYDVLFPGATKYPTPPAQASSPQQ